MEKLTDPAKLDEYVDANQKRLTEMLAGEAWREILRVMTLAEGEDFEERPSEDLEWKALPVPGGNQPVFWFRFEEASYSLEPATGAVVELTAGRSGTMRTRFIDREGREALDASWPITRRVGTEGLQSRACQGKCAYGARTGLSPHAA